MNYKTRFIILIIVIIVLIIAVGVIYYSWQNRSSQPGDIINQNEPVAEGTVEQAVKEVIEVKKAAPAGTLEYCQLFEGAQYITCVLNLAYKDNNLQYCDLVDDVSLKEHCNNRVNLQIAVNQNINQCFYLAEVVQTSCVMQHLDKASDKNQVCNQITDQANKEFCQQLLPTESGGPEA